MTYKNKLTDQYRQYLFCPGPVNVAENVKNAAVNFEIGHREREFSQLLKSVQKRLLQLYEVKSDAYLPIIVSGSGTAANETVLSSVVGDQRILVLSNGEFGDRLFEISSLHNKNTHVLHFGLANRIDVQKVEKYLKTHPVDIIAMVHHETCTGMLNPIDKVGRLTRKYKKLFFVDSVSSASVEKIDVESWNIGFITSAASKAIGSLSGISFVIGKKSEFEKLKKIPARTTYLNLYKFYHYATTLYQTPNTPAVPLFFSFNQALGNIIEEGVAKRRKKIKNRAFTLRAGMQKLGLRFFIDEKDMCSMLTTVYIPRHITWNTLRNKLLQKDIVIYGGKGVLKDKVFQVANIGEMTDEHIGFFLATLQEVLYKTVKRPVVKKQAAEKKNILTTILNPIPAPTRSRHVLAYDSKRK